MLAFENNIDISRKFKILPNDHHHPDVHQQGDQRIVVNDKSLLTNLLFHNIPLAFDYNISIYLEVLKSSRISYLKIFKNWILILVDLQLLMKKIISLSTIFSYISLTTRPRRWVCWPLGRRFPWDGWHLSSQSHSVSAEYLPEIPETNSA